MAKARATKRADGRYQRKVYLGIDKDGKQKYKYLYGTTAKEVDRKAEELLYNLHKGTDVLYGDLPFSRWAERYLRLKEGRVADVYFTGIKSRVAFWNKEIGDIPMSKITRSQMQVALDALAVHNPNKNGAPSSVKTLRDYRLTASAVFELAIVDRAITYNPARYIDINGGEPKNERRALTQEEQQWICDTPHRAQTGAMIMMYAGLRRGELLALRVCDIDLQHNTITVDKAVKFVNNGKPEIKRGGKTDAAARVVHIPSVLTEYLRNALSGKSPFDLVMTDAKGQLMSQSAFRRLWESYQSELNIRNGKFTEPIKSKFDPRVKMVIPKITAHMLRHTACTNMVLSGMDVLTVKEQMGHSSISITMDVYSHITKEHAEKQISKLDAYLAQKSG